MPNAVKYSTTNASNSLRKGNVALGTGNVGPTSTTGFYTVLNPGAYQYVVYKVAASGDPDVFTPSSDANFIRLAAQEGATGTSLDSLSASVDWFSSQANYIVSNFEYPNIVTDGLVAIFDGGYMASYPTTSSTWYDLSGFTNNGSLINGTSFNSANSGSMVFDGTDDYVSITDASSLYFPNSMSIQMFVKLDTLPPATSGNRMYLVCKGENNQFEWQSSINNFSSDFGKWCFLNYAATSPGGSLNGGSFRGRASAVDATTGTWTGVAFTVADVNSFNDVYVNGALNNGSTLSQNTMNKVDGTSNVRLGTRNFGEKYLDGNLGIVLLYTKQLSAAEVLQNHNALKGRFGL